MAKQWFFMWNITFLTWIMRYFLRLVKGFVMGADEAKQRLKAYAAWKTGNHALMLPKKTKVNILKSSFKWKTLHKWQLSKILNENEQHAYISDGIWYVHCHMQVKAQNQLFFLQLEQFYNNKKQKIINISSSIETSLVLLFIHTSTYTSFFEHQLLKWWILEVFSFFHSSFSCYF